MYNDDTQSRRKLAEIGVRFLARTVGEVATLQNLLARLPNSEISNESGNEATKATTEETSAVHDVLKQMEMISHRIRGSGAVFGLEAISLAAECVETLALQAINQSQSDQSQVNLPQVTQQLTQAVAKLSIECANSDGSLPKMK